MGLFNLSNTMSKPVTVAWESLGLDTHRSCLVRDLWEHSDLGSFAGHYCRMLPPHEMAFLRIVPGKEEV